jgi:voltage-gated sodium channel
MAVIEGAVGRAVSDAAPPRDVREKTQGLLRRLPLCGKYFGEISIEQEVLQFVAQWKRDVVASGNKIPEDEGYDLEGMPPEKFVDRWYFNAFVGCVIMVNVFIMGVEIDYRMAGKDVTIFAFLEMFFLLAYSAELIWRIFSHGWEFFFQPGMDIWNRLDAFIVLTSWLDYLILARNDYGGFGVFATLRILRLERLLRLLRLFRIFKELLLVAFAILASLRIMFWFVIVLVVLCFVAGCFLVPLVGQANLHYDARYREIGFEHEVLFGTLPQSLLTLAQILTLDMGFTDVIHRNLCQEDPGMALLVTVFTLIASFGILNTMIAVVVDAVLTSSKKYHDIRERVTKEKEKHIFFELQSIFRQSDVNGSGALDIEEVKEACNTPEIYNKMKMIDFPVEGLVDVFHVLDFDESGELTIDEFINGCERMRGCAKSKDLLEAQLAVNRMGFELKSFEDECDAFSEKIELLSEVARGMLHQGEQVFLNQQEYRVRHKSHIKQKMPTINLDALDEQERAFWAPDAGDQQSETSGSYKADQVHPFFAALDDDSDVHLEDIDNHHVERAHSFALSNHAG